MCVLGGRFAPEWSGQRHHTQNTTLTPPIPPPFKKQNNLLEKPHAQQELGAQLALEASKHDSPWRPYLDALPTLSAPRQALSWESFPTEYLHLLQDAYPLAAHVINRQAALQHYWAHNGAGLAAQGLTLEDVRAALVTVRERER